MYTFKEELGQLAQNISTQMDINEIRKLPEYGADLQDDSNIGHLEKTLKVIGSAATRLADTYLSYCNTAPTRFLKISLDQVKHIPDYQDEL
jgi:hypothetical protein